VRVALNWNFAADGPKVTEWERGQQLVVIPVTELHPRDVAIVAITSGSQREVAERLLAALLESHTERQKLQASAEMSDGFVQQITADFEELAWLRKLTTHIDMLNIEHPIQEVAAEILPTLRALVSAQALVFFPSVDHTTTEPVWLGDQVVSVGVCHELIKQFGSAARQQIVVCNRSFHSQELPATMPEVQSLILAAVGKGDRQSGWLLVVNRQLALGASLISAAQLNLGENEFGTCEAGIVTAATTLLGGHGHNWAMFQEQEALFRGTVAALVNAIDAKDAYTRGHSDRVGQMARRLAKQLGLDPDSCERLYMTGLVHDVGKIGVPDEVLRKPDKLTDEEFSLIKQHPEIGFSILKHVTKLAYTLPGVLHHHESFDGKGYPHGLSGEDIPLAGRLLAVIDAFDAMTSCRPYRDGMPVERAERILREGSGTQWDPVMIDAFFQTRADMHAICGLDCGTPADLKTAVAPVLAELPATMQSLVPF
jgi:HD-GYP domain-containing protein (c-di-GMP phosphodiesterase class II)